VAVNVTAGWTDRHGLRLCSERLSPNMACIDVLSPLVINDKKSG